MAAYRRVHDLRSPAGWLPVHRDQLRAQRSVSSMGSLYLFYITLCLKAVQQQQQPFYSPCPGQPGWASTRRNTHPPTILIIIQSLSASSIYHNPYHPPCSNNLLACQPFCTTSLHVLFGLPLGLEPSTSYSIHFFTKSVSPFRNKMPIPSQTVLL